ncbi:hypothetical protein GP486_008953, partial [Trichoglossum hirsutum]
GVEILSPIGSFFDQAFLTFRRSFERRTGKAWEDRLDAVAEHGEKEVVEGKYFYQPPKGKKKPKGVLPSGKVVVTPEMAGIVPRGRVEEEEEEAEEEDTGSSDDDEDDDEDDGDEGRFSTDAPPSTFNGASAARPKPSLIF